jgi:hypothetical protein
LAAYWAASTAYSMVESMAVSTAMKTVGCLADWTEGSMAASTVVTMDALMVGLKDE